MVWLFLFINHLLAIGFVFGRYLFLVAASEGLQVALLVVHLSCGLFWGLGWLLFALYYTQSNPDWRGIALLHLPVVTAVFLLSIGAATAAAANGDVSGSFFVGGGSEFGYTLGLVAAYGLASFSVFMHKVRRRSTSRYQAGFLLVGALTPSLSAGMDVVLYLTGAWMPPGLPALPVIGVAVSTACQAVGLLCYNVVDIVRRGVYENLREIILVFDLEGRIVDANLTAKRLCDSVDMPRDLGHMRVSLGDKVEDPTLFDDLIDHMDRGAVDPFEGELRLREETKTRYLSVYALPVDARGGIVGWVVTMGDVTRLRTDLDRARIQAITDDLTGLYNRRFVNEELARKVLLSARTGTDLAVVMIDVDHFKAINDLYGHQSGDRVLAAVAQVIKESLRPSDTVARYGGEEFLVMCAGTDKQGGMVLAERLRRNIARCRIVVDGTVVSVTVSVGVAAVQVGTDTGKDDAIERILREADKALYQAKNMGRNCVAAVAVTIDDAG